MHRTLCNDKFRIWGNCSSLTRLTIAENVSTTKQETTLFLSRNKSSPYFHDCFQLTERGKKTTMFEYASKQWAVCLSIPPSCGDFLLLHLRHPDINIPKKKKNSKMKKCMAYWVKWSQWPWVTEPVFYLHLVYCTNVSIWYLMSAPFRTDSACSPITSCFR